MTISTSNLENGIDGTKGSEEVRKTICDYRT